MVPFALVPFLFLGTLVRARMIQSGAVGELMARLGETPRRGELRDALAEALGDPSLELAYWLPDDERYVDARGHAVELPAPRLGPRGDQGRARGRLRRGDRPRRGRCRRAARAGSTRSARPRRSRSRTSGSTPSCARKVEELRASRARIVQRRARGAPPARARPPRRRAAAARRAGAQPAARARPACATTRPAPSELLDGAGDGARGRARASCASWRAASTRRCSATAASDTALEALAAARAAAGRAASACPAERLPEAVEPAAYFVVAEALTNVAKYAAGDARERRRRARQRPAGRARGATTASAAPTPSVGTGLRGLADRVAALDGRLEVDSEPGQRNRPSRREIPCA